MSKIKVAELVVEGLQTREGVNDAVVRDYAKEMADGVVFDPPVVFFDGTKHYLADGFHRIEAMKRRGDIEVEADVREGTRTDAIRFALSANAKHGLKRTPADIRRCLEVAWENRVELFGGEPSHEVLASACNVSTKTVQRFFRRRETSKVDSVHPEKSVTKPEVDGDCAEKPAGKVRSSWEDDPVIVGGEVFNYFSDPEGEKARDQYLAHQYGTFGKGLDGEWKKDRCGHRVPNNLREIIGIPILDDFDMLLQCVSKAYDILEDDAGAPFMKELLESKCKPLELIKRLRKAVLDAELNHLCHDCHGKGCLQCRYKGYVTWGDIRRHMRDLREKRESEKLLASIKAKCAVEAKASKPPVKVQYDPKNPLSVEELLDAMDGRPPQPKNTPVDDLLAQMDDVPF